MDHSLPEGQGSDPDLVHVTVLVKAPRAMDPFVLL